MPGKITLVTRAETRDPESKDAFENEGVEIWRVVSDIGEPVLVVLDYHETDIEATLAGRDVARLPYFNMTIAGIEVSPRLLVECCVSSGEGPTEEGESVVVDVDLLANLSDQGYTLKEEW